MSAHWKALHLEDDSLPQLLVKARLDSSGYGIYLTDLSRTWGEDLTKRKIRVRADAEDCSIDPSEGDDQYQILLGKLRQAINQEDDTSLKLLLPKEQDGGISLELSAPLPSPLPDFRWRVQLSPLVPQSLETSLVRPLLQHAQNLEQQIQQLVHELAEKDRVISKVTDRLETSGNDLTAVFPGVSNIKISRKKSQREQLARHVKGLGDFDEAAWKAQHAGMDSKGRFEEVELNGLLAGLPEGAADGADEQTSSEWWRALGQGASSGDHGASWAQRKHARTDVPVNGRAGRGSEATMDHDDDVEGEFQRQGTPPGLKQTDGSPSRGLPQRPASRGKSNGQVAAADSDEESTEDEDDLDAPPRKAGNSQRSGSTAQARQRTATPDTVAPTSSARPSPSPAKQAIVKQEPVSPTKPRGKLGTIGGKSKASATPEPTRQMEVDEAPTQPRGKLGALCGKAKASATPEPTVEDDVEVPAKQRKKLGALGGGKNKVSAAPTPEPPSPQAATAKPHKLGSLGGRKAASAATEGTVASTSRQASEAPSAAGTEDTPARQSRALERKPKEPTPLRETSQERADMKREELKRKMAAEATAAGGKKKKKRKF